MKKVILSSILILLVLLSFSLVSASWFSGAWTKMTGHAVVTNSNVLQNCVQNCLTFACSEKQGFSKKMCGSKNNKACLNSCKKPVENNPAKINKQVAKVSDLDYSGCLGNVCKLREAETLKVQEHTFSIDFISSDQVKLRVDDVATSVLTEGQFALFPNFKILIADIVTPEYSPETGEPAFVIFSTHRNNLPKVVYASNATFFNVSKR